MKKEKKELAKLALAGLLLASTLPAAANAAGQTAKETYLAVAGCSSCNHNAGNSYGCNGRNAPNPYAGGNVAEADNYATPPGHGSGGVNGRQTGNPNLDHNYGTPGANARTAGGNYANPNDPASRRTNNPYGN